MVMSKSFEMEGAFPVGVAEQIGIGARGHGFEEAAFDHLAAVCDAGRSSYTRLFRRYQRPARASPAISAKLRTGGALDATV
jgi:hypothetical protein